MLPIALGMLPVSEFVFKPSSLQGFTTGTTQGMVNNAQCVWQMALAALQRRERGDIAWDGA